MSEDLWTINPHGALKFSTRKEARDNRYLGEKVVAYEREVGLTPYPYKSEKRAILDDTSFIARPADSYDTTFIHLGRHSCRIKVCGSTDESGAIISGRPLAQAICDFLNSEAFRKMNIE